MSNSDLVAALLKKLGLTRAAAIHIVHCDDCDIMGCGCCSDTFHLEYVEPQFFVRDYKGEK